MVSKKESLQQSLMEKKAQLKRIKEKVMDMNMQKDQQLNSLRK